MTEKKLNNEEVTVDEQITTEDVVKESRTIDTLFMDNVQANTFSGANQLGKTAQLTQVATMIANKIMAEVTANPEEYQAKVLASQKSHDAMDDLIGELYTIKYEDGEFLYDEDADDLEKMIRSQQSKRSRSKAKVMTRENYMTMMTGAVAELILRDVAGKPKSAGGGAAMGDIGFSDEDLQQLAQFPDDLKKAIRNVQSKKSIMKSKADFNADSPRWQQLLRAEQQLKEVRDRSMGAVSKQAEEALSKQKQLEEMLVAAETASPDEAKNLLDAVREMLASR